MVGFKILRANLDARDPEGIPALSPAEETAGRN